MTITAIPVPGAVPPRPDDPLMRKARELEASFLAEMLAHAGLGEAGGGDGNGFGGGIGEAQFASFLRAEQARLMVARGGIGLAEILFRAMGGQDDA